MIRVRTRPRARGAAGWSALIGFGVGAVMVALARAALVGRFQPTPVGPNLTRWFVLLVLVPTFVFVTCAALATPRRSLVALCAFGYASAHTVTFAAWVAVQGAGSESLNPVTLFVLALLAMTIAVIVAGAAQFVPWLLHRSGVQVLEQDGSLCWHCGYVMDPPSLKTCPECGRNDPLVGAQGWFARLCGLRSRWLGGAMCIALCAFMVRSVVVEGAYGRLHGAFPSAQNGHVSAQVLGRHGDTWRGRGCLLPVSRDRALLVLYQPSARPPRPTMQVRLVWRLPAAGSFVDGLPAIACDLDRRMAEKILSAGEIPTPVVSSLERAAGDLGWTPPIPTPNAPGVFSLSNPAASELVHFVDPDEAKP